jgi:3-oxosteroid 1-dehydrogenase
MSEAVQVDIVIVGSGVSGMTAALAAHSRGLRPLVVEKAAVLGGTSAWSGGVLWIPNNPVMLEAGATDSTQDALLYLDSVVGDQGPATSPARKRAFVENGPRMIEFMRGLGVPFLYNDGFPDYYPNLPGGHERGRSLNTAILDLADLGDWNGRLRRQKGSGLKVDLLMERYGEAPDMTRMMTTLAGARMAARIVGRTVWAAVTRREKAAMGLSLMGQLLLAAQRQGIEFWTGAPLSELIISDGGAHGVIVERDGVRVEVRARCGVVLTAGGFAHNEAMRKQYGRQPASVEWTSVPPEDTGEAILLGIEAGAATALMDEAVWTPASILPDGTPVPALWERAMPHSIMVDGSGARFCNEAASYMECGQDQYERNKSVPAFPSWLIIDSWHRRRYPFGSAPPGRTPKEWLTSGYMKKADTLDELAGICQIDPAGLAATVERFNRMAATGVDEDFHRGETAYDREYGQPGHRPNECLGALDKPPFYAVACYPGDVGTVGGLLTDEHSRVLREDGSVIDGLYAAGANSATVMGRVYPGAGATLGPGAVFGYIAGMHAAEHAASVEAG